MRRILILIVAIMATGASLPAWAAPPSDAPAAQTSHLDSSGRGGTAIWTTCPEEPKVGTVCTGTFLSAVFVVKENRVPVRTAMALFEQFTVLIEERLQTTVLSSTTASGEIDLDIDRGLTEGSFEARLGSQTCVPAGEEFSCEEGTIVVNGTWSGQGELVRFKDHATPSDVRGGPTFLIVHEQGRFRSASAVASVDGTLVPGDLVFAELFDTRRSFILVCRGGPNTDPADCPAP